MEMVIGSTGTIHINPITLMLRTYLLKYQVLFIQLVIGQPKYWIVYIVHCAFNNEIIKHRLFQQEKDRSN